MKTIKALGAMVGQAGVTLCAMLATQAALAVNSLPGGPAVNQLDLHPPVTQIARDQQWLHYFVMVICTVIFVGVFGVMFYSIFKHRRSRKAPKPPTSTKASPWRSPGRWCPSSS